MDTRSDNLRRLPAVHRVLSEIDAGFTLPRPLVMDVIRDTLSAARTATSIPDKDAIVSEINQRLQRLERSRLQPVINATGVVLHTNLGRAPLGLNTPKSALAAAQNGYTNLELDLESGQRGRRGTYAERLLAALCQAEDALVVNNCAAALVLSLQALIRPERAEVLISRGELIQIGGGFRIPDILETSGAVLREVGATNQTDLRDYQRAHSDRVALVLKTHWSNFTMRGFVASPSMESLTQWAHETGLPIIEDLGSGAMIDTRTFLPDLKEPTPRERIQQGVDLVLFSGDKLLGGPQAGVIVGKRDLVSQLRTHPLYRALRCDKLILAALQDTVEGYLLEPPTNPLAVSRLNESAATLRRRAQNVADALPAWASRLEVAELFSESGGGTLPEARIPSAGLLTTPGSASAKRFHDTLRHQPIPIIGRIERDRVALDFRTILSNEAPLIIQGLGAALAQHP